MQPVYRTAHVSLGPANVCGRDSNSDPVCYVCETDWEPVLPLWLKREAKINMGADALEWKRSKCELSFSVLVWRLFCQGETRTCHFQRTNCMNFVSQPRADGVSKQHKWYGLNSEAASNTVPTPAYFLWGTNMSIAESSLKMYSTWEGNFLLV
jgi:hypothetical protein